MTNEQLLQRIAVADVSEAAKDFYRRHLSDNYSITGGWDDDYALIRELDDANLVKTTLVYLDNSEGTEY